MGSLSATDDVALQYPVVRRDDSVVDDYHGVLVSDPYRWLEDPEAEEVKDFVQKQVKLTESVLEKCEMREKLCEKITKLFDHPRYYAPFRRGDKYFYFHNTGLQAQNILYVQDSLNGEPEVLLDPNGLSEDGTVSLNTYAVSEDAKYLAYGLSSSGSDWITIKVMRVDNKSVEPDTLSWVSIATFINLSIPMRKITDSPKVKFSGVSWTHDGKGFFYSRYPAPKDGENVDAGTETNVNLNQEVYYHFLGTNQSEDILCWRDPDNPKYSHGASVTEDGKLRSHLSDVKCVLQLRDLKTGALLQNLPMDIGTVSEISARREDSIAFIGFTSFLSPGIIYQCNLDTGVPDVKIFREIVVPGFDRTAFNVNQVFVPSKDGTQIPMFIVARKDILLDGSHPCLLYAYGGFNISITPSFSVSRIVLTKHLDTIFCIANIRGGGEYGEEWHKAGSLAKKQNCFDDFISAAEFLVSAGYTQSRKLCIEGGSNGGLLIGACINQRPDLFGCALAHVGVMDMLRFHKFTIGHAWTSDFGCSEKEEEFHWLIKYSPLHNVRRPWEQSPDQSSQYPSTMLLTADHDDRVVPLHSLKLLATMQYVLCTSLDKSPQTNPIIGRIECKAGHGAGRPTQKQIDEAADRYGFMAKMLGASWSE
ncbi:hypothetical protein RHSIM_Rhsim07G0252600 [Rhododendron simsii]|uniref:Prolyl endopeptidase n=1 Tax=Rhododendron simsii TaxID=118357 RepID=A0A834H178_RHOSS|nr:hypothetical protein RHSIM_Rhsim07G0252600 [Rhododendron simsii]